MTDVVDSTPLAERLDSASLTALWDAHDRTARKLMRQWRGREIDSSDGFLLLFADASDALDYALAYHAAIRELPVPLQARAGLHVGPVVMRSNDQEDVSLGAKPLAVEGIAKPLVARVASLGRGGQTLLTAEALAALSRPAPGVEERHWWRMKGVEQPVRLYEVVGPAGVALDLNDSDKGWRVFLRGDVWLPLREHRHSLPADPDAFIGRQPALQAIRRRFEGGAKLVSLLGIGGVGKTRLARRYGWTWLGDYAGGVWFCDLSSARSLEGVCHAVAQGLDVPLGRTDPVVQLGDALAGRGKCLVILDNFEQVVEQAEATLGRWMGRAAQASFLVTSRERLALRGESAMQVDAMDPAESGALFRFRAASARGEPLSTGEDDLSVAALVKLLDGLPLAIELAAARATVMSVADMLKRMNRRFALLISSRSRADRQGTLRAAFDWSWDLLTESERSTLAQLAVFEGSFTLAAAEAVVLPDPGSGASGGIGVIDVLQELVEQSLLRRKEDGRFDLLSSLREYAAERLVQASQLMTDGLSLADRVATKHASYYASLDEHQAVAEGSANVDNLAAACRYAAARGLVDPAVGALEASWYALRRRGPFNLGLVLAEAAWAMPGLGLGERARVAHVRGAALRGLGRRAEALSGLKQALDDASTVGDSRTEVRVRSLLGDLCIISGDTVAARVELEHAIALARQISNKGLECEVLTHLGNLFESVGDLAQARTNYKAALEVAQASGDKQNEGATLGNLGALDADQGRVADALDHYERALAISREVGDKHREGDVLCNLGLLHYVQGRLDESRSCLLGSLQVAQEMGYVRLGVVVMCNLGIVREALGETAEAREAFEGALTAARAMGERRSEGQVLSYLGALLARSGEADAADRLLAQAEQVLNEGSDGLSMGILRCHRAEAACLARDRESAQAHLHEARRLAVELAAEPQSELGLALARVSRLLEAPWAEETSSPSSVR
ncbi:MAG: tetratricopeptide repeat protein [Burkholderiales bacterium]|nr:tetratricopeptide repeat protein [Burkholderiales bacterium]